ncbi:MAG: hypothetical protein AAB217_24335 [Chloroflexota bacterium]
MPTLQLRQHTPFNLHGSPCACNLTPPLPDSSLPLPARWSFYFTAGRAGQ